MESFESSDWITLVAVIGAVLVTPPFTAWVTGRKEKRARTEEPRDEAYTRLLLALNIDRSWLQLVVWRGVEYQPGIVPIVSPDEQEWLDARIQLVGSKPVRQKYAAIREAIDKYADDNSNLIERSERLRANGSDPDSDPECVGVWRGLYQRAGVVLHQIDDLETQLRAEITFD